jgi:hypothetical protein
MISSRGARSTDVNARADRLDLHLVDLRMQDRQPAASGAAHRIGLAKLLHVGDELVQRRVE